MGGTDALRRLLGLTCYTRKGLSSSAVKALQQADKTLASNFENNELEDLPGIANSARQSAEQVELTLTTIDDRHRVGHPGQKRASWARKDNDGSERWIGKQSGKADEHRRSKIRGRKTPRPGASKTDGIKRH